ncbi:MAG: O-antigen ligase family protein [Anaerolineae bacterium]|jgi:O-antigen ligase|nr:polymerase [Chloroflexota bacterium]
MYPERLWAVHAESRSARGLRGARRAGALSIASILSLPDRLVAALQSADKGTRLLATLLLCGALALPSGAIIGLLGVTYGVPTVLALAMAYLVLRSVMVGLVALIAVILLLPFAALPVDVGFAPTLLDLVIGALFFVWLSRIVSHRDGEFVAWSPTLLVLTFVFLALFSFVNGLGHAELTANVLRHVGEILLSILLFLLVINAVRTAGQLRLLVRALIVAGTLAAAIGIILYVLPTQLTVRLLSSLSVLRYPSGNAVLRYIESDPSRALRATSTSVDPNVLGGALIFVTTLATAQLFAERPLIARRWLVCFIGLLVLCLILTFSRGSFFGLAVALFFLALLRYPRLLWIGLAALVLIYLLPWTQTYVNHFISGLRGEDLATQMRFGEYKDALILISRYPWFGVGFAGTPEVDTYLGVSNVYLLIAENMGIVGLLVFLATMGTHLVGILRALRSPASAARVSATTLGLYLAIVGALAGGLLDHYLFNVVFPHASSLLWLTVGLGTVSLRLDQREPAGHDRPLVEELFER